MFYSVAILVIDFIPFVRLFFFQFTRTFFPTRRWHMNVMYCIIYNIGFEIQICGLHLAIGWFGLRQPPHEHLTGEISYSVFSRVLNRS